MRGKTRMLNGLTAAIGLVLLFVAVGGGASQLVLVGEGQPAATIVIAEDASEKVTLAAEELRTYLEKMSGAKLAIGTDAEEQSGAVVFVGPGAGTEALDVEIPSGLTHARREEGFIIVRKGDRLVLAGNDRGPYHGTEYAVYEFLRRLGVRWFMPGEYGEYVPRRETISVGTMRVRESPDFIMRNWWLHAKPHLREPERRWKLRNKMNPDNMFAIPGDSSVRKVLPAEKYFEEHPEYFALNPDGSRNPHHPNLTNPKTIEIAAGIIKDYFREHPEANSYGFAPDDGRPRDYSPKTLELHQGFTSLLGRPGVPAEESTTEQWLHFVNNVTRQVREEFPDVYIATNGYANRNRPPQGMELDDHLIIMFAAIWSCTLHPYDDGHCWQKVRQGRMLKRWCELCDNVWVYGYNYQMLVSGLTPLPETRKLARDLRLMRKWGVIGFHDETRNVWAECGIPSRYLRAQLEWDAESNVGRILNDFYTHWYGAAAGPMRAFYNAIETAIQRTPLHGHEDRVMPYVYTPGLLKRLAAHIERAERDADSDRARLHVRADRLIYEHLKGYMAMYEAAWAGEFGKAARHAKHMMDLRGELHAINPFYIWPDEQRYHSGIWYWGIEDRRQYFEKLDDMTAGETGDLVVLAPERAAFRIDPHDDGIASEWYAMKLDRRDWRSISTTKPFYIQGYEDERGHTYLGNMWYRIPLDVPKSASGRSVRLYAPVVETEAWVWVNGQYIGHRPYMEAYVRPAQIDMDVTDAIRPGQRNTVAIRVNTSLCAAAASGGLQSRVFLYAPKE